MTNPILSLQLLTPLFAAATTASSATLTDVFAPLTYAAGPFTVSNPTPVPQVAP